MKNFLSSFYKTLSSTRMETNFIKMGSVFIAVIVSACSVIPSTIINKPDPASVSAVPPMIQRNNLGSIYSSTGYRSMFDGRRASLVGDTLTINIVENTAASKSGAGSTSKKGSASSSFAGISGNTFDPSFNISNANKNDTAASNTVSNTFNGYITVSVIDVRPNGHLVVSGEKQVASDMGIEFVRFSGVVNPDMIATGNNVSSNTVSDARVEYRTTATLDMSNIASTLTRFFFSISPF